MRATWLYYDYLRRFGILILLGFAIGALLGFVYYEVRPKRTWYIAQADISIPRGLQFRIVSPKFPDPQSAVDHILNMEFRLESASQLNFESNRFEIESWYRPELWKTMAVGSVVGGLVAIGVGYVWNDAMIYQRRRREGESDVQ
jgi:hypothetical protein